MTKPRKWGTVLAVIIALYTVLGFLVLPAIIKSQMLKRLPALTHRNVAVQQVKLNPYALSFTLRGFSLTETNGEEFASLGELYVNFQAVSLFKRGFVFSEISIKKPSANVIRLANGEFNFANLLTNSAPTEAKPVPQKQQPLPLVMIDELKIEDGRLAFTDFDRRQAFQRRFGPINVRLTKFTTRPKEGSPYSIVVDTADGETFAWSGDFTLTPLQSAGTFKLTGLHVDKYAAYAEDSTPVRVHNGRVDFATDYHFAMPSEAISLMVSNASLMVSNLQVSVAEPKPARASIDQLQLTVSGISLDTAAKKVEIANVRLADLQTGVTLLPGPTVTQAVAATVAPASKEPAATTTTAAGSSTNKFRVAVGEVALANVSFHFADESIEPNVKWAVDQFGGTVKDLTSDLNTVAAVDLNGKMNGYAPFSITGKINPLSSELFVDLAVLLKDATLMPGSPYAAKYVGFPLEKGALSLDLRYYVTQQELKAENKVRVDQLTLGAASGSPQATKLPVKLGIALLQDRHGVIALDVPVSGRLDDPKFKLGPLIMQVFMNVMTKAMTKPFALLGSLFGGGEDLDHINFDVGTAQFAAGEVTKLDSLATALYERPALKLGIAGSVDPVKDREALAKLKLEAKLCGMRAKELEAAGQKVASVDSVRLTPEDRKRLIELAYAEAMGLVSSKASKARTETVLSHLTTKTNFEPLRKVKVAPPQVTNATNASPPAAAVATAADMEAKLIELTEITPDDFKKLMSERAAAVQSYLLQTGKVTPERLTLVEPKPVDASFQGSSRANLSLQ
jgi:Domain of Unknown Function (DUF748)